MPLSLTSALLLRLIAGLIYLQHTFDSSDEAVVNTWVEKHIRQHWRWAAFTSKSKANMLPRGCAQCCGNFEK
ncbi:hypothetical protein [Acidovorax cavernicola]|uniref:Uncharacterized protein n=1 Tax=Acidovorax cavernicola TaxID=1675792 RepID=A0A9X8GWV0_9BURK|nr:hypothetical protein [Acidovorax cavernicola]RIX83177.1 hypothetical protein D3H34_06990 [Acidovorax cavernicola]